MRHAEALLFVHDQQAEVVELHVLGKHAMRADQDVHPTGFRFFQNFLLLFFRAEAADHFHAHGKRGEPPLESLVVLEGQDGGRREHRDLLGIGDGLERGAHGHFRLAVADVAAEQPVHRQIRFHVALHVFDGALLVGGFFELEGVVEFVRPIRVGGNECPTAIFRSA